MNITILKIESNEKFINPQDPNYYILTFLTKRLWLSEEIPVTTDGSVVYELSFKNGLSVEGKIFDKGLEETGFYFVFNMSSFNLRNEFEEVDRMAFPCGKATLTEVFDPNEDAAFGTIYDTSFKESYFFNNCDMRYARTGDELILNFSLGSLGNIAFVIELSGVISEKSVSEKNGGFDIFTGGNIKNVYFRKYNKGEYAIIIDNTQKDFIFPEGANCFSQLVEPIIVKHVNEYYIYCRQINVLKYNYFVNVLSSNGISYSIYDCSNDELNAVTLRERWKEAFLKGVDTENIYLEQFLWHVFSNGRLQAVIGEEADKLLDESGNGVLFVFFNDAPYSGRETVYRLENAASFNHKMLMCFQDVYVVDESFSRTYVRTHENFCGPYYYDKGAMLPRPTH